ncbi:TRAP transporter small permease subunit [Roseicyclus sp. F158]|uniref:TRAP transporter small permease protein n=1 Tax=Tropicimonas omnivorans TaxID=3075590 RepID=A0ABU3DJS4_9RHOB|nr:TRAP transporter small permease subunit [Roseicyclus sp. F158]MDT0683964.1 TRAP transporter small permease subunit [Roseicyclus sp. F158]
MRGIGVLIERAARGMAVLAGIGLLGLSAMVCVSVIGRALTGLGLGPVRGDYELMANGCGIAVFWVLPWATLSRAHVRVDIAASRLPARLREGLGTLGDLSLALAAFVILRQLWLGFGEKLPYGSEALRAALGLAARPYYTETTFDLGLPVWALLAAALAGAIMTFVAAVRAAWVSLAEAMS